MKTTTFFAYYRELVLFRWVVRFGPNGAIYLRSLVSEAYEKNEHLNPLSAVAVDVYGSGITNPHDASLAMSALELPRDFGRLVFIASSTATPSIPKAVWVRDELLLSLQGESVLYTAFCGRYPPKRHSSLNN